MHEEYHSFYKELRRFRRLTLEEFQLELAMMDQGDAWQQFKQVRRKLKPANY